MEGRAAKMLAEMAQTFYTDPNNVKAYKKWKRKQKRKGKKS